VDSDQVKDKQTLQEKEMALRFPQSYRREQVPFRLIAQLFKGIGYKPIRGSGNSRSF
jgi:hypothetical protein